ncbi:RNA-directed DNA polymerase, eukaryota [Tanacetum coccineum]|uniref:RNA-directed DNA polymerase, eukaryota n=1 Tax=Tanacetum coccineum TaxID=301880 RepID=A0ABQ5CNE4_9ASTR
MRRRASITIPNLSFEDEGGGSRIWNGRNVSGWILAYKIMIDGLVRVDQGVIDMMPRGGVEQENYGLLCSKVADLVLPNISDRWCWSLEGSQEFSVKSSRILIDNTILPKAEVPTRWLRVVPIKVNVHAWRVCLDKLPTRANLSLRGMDIPSIACPLCNSAVESTSHIFFACPLARQVWRNFLIWYLLRDVVVNLALQKSIALWEFSTKACSLIR